jgi:hypothetical protein
LKDIRLIVQIIVQITSIMLVLMLSIIVGLCWLIFYGIPVSTYQHIKLTIKTFLDWRERRLKND